METIEAMAAIKLFVMDHGLPRTDLALFGIKCPYCGKSDRIRQLETPEELRGSLAGADLERYTTLWQSLAKKDVQLGFCKFCLNPLKLDLAGGQAEPLFEFD